MFVVFSPLCNRHILLWQIHSAVNFLLIISWWLRAPTHTSRVNRISYNQKSRIWTYRYKCVCIHIATSHTQTPQTMRIEDISKASWARARPCWCLTLQSRQRTPLKFLINVYDILWGDRGRVINTVPPLQSVVYYLWGIMGLTPFGFIQPESRHLIDTIDMQRSNDEANRLWMPTTQTKTGSKKSSANALLGIFHIVPGDRMCAAFGGKEINYY